MLIDAGWPERLAESRSVATLSASWIAGGPSCMRIAEVIIKPAGPSTTACCGGSRGGHPTAPAPTALAPVAWGASIQQRSQASDGAVGVMSAATRRGGHHRRGEEATISASSSGDAPTLSEIGRALLPPGALSYMNTRSAIELVTAALIAMMISSQALDGGVRTAVLLALGGLTAMGLAIELPLLNRLRVRYTSYSAQPGFIYITRGALVRRSVFIASHQIQNVETVQGPLLRRFGFAKVRFKCITNVESLGPLDPSAVVAIRRAVLQLPESSVRADQ